jgi:ribosomal protein L29
MKDLNKKSEKELTKTLAERREDLRKIRFSISGANVKDVKEAKQIRKEIAQILTELNSRNK